MQLNSSLDDKPHNVRRRERRKEMRLHRDLMLQRKIDANRKQYPRLFLIIDHPAFHEWYYRCTGKKWEVKLEANLEEMVTLLNSMQIVYGEIPIPD